MRTPSLRPLLALGATLLLATPAVSQETVAPEDLLPLFRSHDLLRLRIEADFHALRRDREEENPEREGNAWLIRDDGTEVHFPVQLRTRGRFRLQSRTCTFPPIRVNFRKGQVEETLFDGQDKVKLVTHCRDGDRFHQNVVREYLVYRIYNLLTPLSFQARMAEITYLDTSGEEDPVTRLAFFIEMEESLAERLGGEIPSDSVQALGIHPARIHNEHAARVALFQYMVGNTDFSLYGVPGTPPHNVVPVRLEAGGIIPVPYDFDWTGLVNAPYARPDPSLGIRRVTQRVFRGLCRPGTEFGPQYEHFLARREAITGLVREELRLGEDEREDVLEFLEDFWETLEDPDERRERIEEECRPI